MSQRTQTICDECQVVKKESNHWHKVGLCNGGALLLGYEGKERGSEFIPAVSADLCGDGCLHKYIDRELKIGAHRLKQVAEEQDG